MTDAGDAAPKFADVNDAVTEEWVTDTTPYERVRETIAHTYTPVTAGTVADTAHTSPKTARKHLNTLDDDGFVTTGTGENGATTYRRSPESLVVEQAADILEHTTTDDLVARVAEMRDQLADYRDEYGVDTPEELLVDKTNQTLTDPDTAVDVPGETASIDAETIREWKTTRRNLAFANAALSIANAERFVGDDSEPRDGSVLAD